MNTINPERLNPILSLGRNFCITCILCMNVLFASSAWAHEYNALPPPGITLPSSFIEFRNNLKAALAAKDVDAVRAFLADDIQFGFGGSFGPDEFITGLELKRTDGEGWDLLDYLISADAAKTDLNGSNAFILPYTAEYWPEEDDPFNIVIGGSETELRSLPSENGRVVSTLKYPILHIKSETDESDWLEVEASNGIWGYIPAWETATLLGFRMIVENKTDNDNPKWQIVFVGAGD